MEEESRIELDPTSGLVGAERLIYEVLVAKTGFNTPTEAVPMAKQIFHWIESLQGRNVDAEDYANPNGELSADLVGTDELALSVGISKDLAGAILVRLNILKEKPAENEK